MHTGRENPPGDRSLLQAHSNSGHGCFSERPICSTAKQGLTELVHFNGFCSDSLQLQDVRIAAATSSRGIPCSLGKWVKLVPNQRALTIQTSCMDLGYYYLEVITNEGSFMVDFYVYDSDWLSLSQVCVLARALPQQTSPTGGACQCV